MKGPFPKSTKDIFRMWMDGRNIRLGEVVDNAITIYHYLPEIIPVKFSGCIILDCPSEQITYEDLSDDEKKNAFDNFWVELEKEMGRPLQEERKDLLAACDEANAINRRILDICGKILKDGRK